MAVFEFLHISDLHFAQEPGRINLFAQPRSAVRHLLASKAQQPKSADTLSVRFRDFDSHSISRTESCARWLYRNRASNRLVIITGDLATSGLAEDLETAYRILTQNGSSSIPYLSQGGEATFAFMPGKCFLMPGNHDRFSDRQGAPGGANFDQIFSAFCKLRNGVCAASVANQGETLHFVAADFSIRNFDRISHELQLYGVGVVTDDTLQALVDQTERCVSKAPGPVVWLLHFPPGMRQEGTRSKFTSTERELMELVDERMLLDSARRSMVSIVLSGHIHRSIELNIGGLDVVGAGSPTIADPYTQAEAHLMRVEVTKGKMTTWSRQNFVHSPDDADFVQKKT